MDATLLVIVILLSLTFVGILVTLHFSGKHDMSQGEAVTREVIVRALTDEIPVHTRLEAPNAQSVGVDKAPD